MSKFSMPLDGARDRGRGTAGTVCFVDTTQCCHFGSRGETGTALRFVTMNKA